MKNTRFILVFCFLFLSYQTIAQIPTLGKSIIDSVYKVNCELVGNYHLNQDSVRKVLDHDKLYMYHGYTDAMLHKDVAVIYAKVLNDYLYAFKLSDIEAEKYLRKQEVMAEKHDNQHRNIESAIGIWGKRLEKSSDAETGLELLQVQMHLKKLVNATELKRILEACDKLPKGQTCTKFARLKKYTHYEMYPTRLLEGLGTVFYQPKAQ